jgi:GWxTD domain-containing protein
LDVSVNHTAYKGNAENYMELHLYFVGRTMKQMQIDSINSQGSVEVTVLFKQGEKIAKYDKFNVKSPASLDPIDFFEMRRYAIENGVYDLEVSFKDTYANDAPKQYKSQIIIDFDNINLRQSDIQLLSYYRADNTDSKYVRNGYYLETLPFQYYDRNFPTLSFYSETYNADKVIGEDFLFSFSIEKLFANNTDKPILIGHKRQKATPFIANLINMDISQLESGNYKLVTTIRNRNNDLLSQKETFFQRSNPLLNIPLDTLSTDAIEKEFVGQMTPQQLRYALKAIAMNVPQDDSNVLTELIKKEEPAAQKRYLFTYWAKKNAVMPEQAYDEYMMIAKAVDKMYNNGFGYGFESDRGRIYMKYGRPDDIITVENEMNAPPYEVWVFYKLDKTQQTNVKFLFFNPDLIVNGYRLLHSTCRGELNNPRWKHDLYRSVPNQLIGNNVDGRDVQGGFNRRAEQIFNDN